MRAGLCSFIYCQLRVCYTTCDRYQSETVNIKNIRALILFLYLLWYNMIIDIKTDQERIKKDMRSQTNYDEVHLLHSQASTFVFFELVKNRQVSLPRLWQTIQFVGFVLPKLKTQPREIYHLWSIDCVDQQQLQHSTT